jgi:hypothetical protein
MQIQETLIVALLYVDPRHLNPRLYSPPRQG